MTKNYFQNLRKCRYTYIIVAVSICLFGNCGYNYDSSHELIIAGATNLQFALTEIGDNFRTEYPSTLTFVWGSTGSLTNQIENGAPYDLFLAAHESYMHRLQTKGLLIDSADTFISGTIAIGVSGTKKGTIHSLHDFLHPEIKRIVIASPEHAPYGIAAQEALINSGLWDNIQPKLLYAENIRQCLQFIKTGNADAGIISANIPQDEKIGIVALDGKLYTPPRQTAAVLKSSKNRNLAREFVRFLRTSVSTKIFRKYNYNVILN